MPSDQGFGLGLNFKLPNLSSFVVHDGTFPVLFVQRKFNTCSMHMDSEMC